MSMAIDAAALRIEGRRTRKTSEIVARELATYIVDHELVEGTRLPNERDMLEAMGVGRTTLREALRLLETRGVLNIRSGRQGGPVVRRPRPEDLSEALTLILQFEKASLGDVLHTRTAIEPAVARLAAAAATPEQVERLHEVMAASHAHLDDYADFLRASQQFHSLVAEASGNTVLRIFSDSVKSISAGAVTGIEYPPRRRRSVHQAHVEILTAIQDRDGDAAHDAMRRHLEEAGRFWESKHGAHYRVPVRWT